LQICEIGKESDMKRFDLGGKVAVVTGGNGGIGAGLARGLLECGAIVVISGRNKAKNDAAVAELSQVGTVSAVQMDVTDEAQCRGLVQETVRRHSSLDILINNAGIGGGGLMPEDTKLELWNQVINNNLTSAFVLSQAAYPEMKKRGGGKIINIGSMASHLGFPTLAVYASSKAGILGLTKGCASAWGKDNIQVNAILPGYIDTDMTQRLQASPMHARGLARTAAGRLGTPDDFAGIAAFLASSASNFVTGADIAVDGGFLWGI
jgi:2-deoxy-D-gluconate 3-dehydrogenase